MLRLDDDRGAAAVIIAILMVPLLGFAAISIDIAAMHAEKQQLQAGADAAALAIAQDCARDTCGSPRTTAQTFATANSNSGNAVATVANLPTARTGRVTVQNSAVRQHWFAPVLGIDESEINVRASASWGAPIGGTAVLPLTISLCHLYHADIGGAPSWTVERVIKPADNVKGCDMGAESIPGGFGWLETDPGQTCHVTTRIGERAGSEPGNTPKRCDLTAIRGKSVLLPLYVDRGGNGRNAWYEVYGYAAFTVTGYYFSGQSWNPPCRGSDRCISGYFTQIHHTEPDFDYGPGAPNLGAAAVFLLPD